MNGLQRAIEERPNPELDRVDQFSNVGSGGIGGFGGVAIVSKQVILGEEWKRGTVPPVQIQPSSSTGGLVGGYRTRELEWRRTHAEVLRGYANEWVALEGEEIVAHGSDPMQVITEARARGIRTPYIFFVEPFLEGVVRIGL